MKLTKPCAIQRGPVRYLVEYVVPVLCEVDLEADDVLAVRVADGELCRTGGVFDNRGAKARGAAAEQAIATAEAQEWPAWTFGF